MWLLLVSTATLYLYQAQADLLTVSTLALIYTLVYFVAVMALFSGIIPVSMRFSRTKEAGKEG